MEYSEETSASWRHVQSQRRVVESARVGGLEEMNVVLHRSVRAVRRLETRLEIIDAGVQTSLGLRTAKKKTSD